MRITLGQLREMVEQVAGGGSGWVPTAQSIRFVEYRDENDEPIVDENGELVTPDQEKPEDAYVVFYVDGPWQQGPLKVVVWMSYLFGALSGRSSDPPTNNEIELWWSRPVMRADWEETSMQLGDLAMAADGAGILL
jgi:hypothetical protein